MSRALVIGPVADPRYAHFTTGEIIASDAKLYIKFISGVLCLFAHTRDDLEKFGTLMLLKGENQSGFLPEAGT